MWCFGVVVGGLGGGVGGGGWDALVWAPLLQQQWCSDYTPDKSWSAGSSGFMLEQGWNPHHILQGEVRGTAVYAC